MGLYLVWFLVDLLAYCVALAMCRTTLPIRRRRYLLPL